MTQDNNVGFLTIDKAKDQGDRTLGLKIICIKMRFSIIVKYVRDDLLAFVSWRIIAPGPRRCRVANGSEGVICHTAHG